MKNDVISFVVGIALAILIVALAFNVWAADASGAGMVYPQETLTMSATWSATPYRVYLPAVGGGE